MAIEKLLPQAPEGWLTSDEMGAYLGMTRQAAVARAVRGELEAVRVSSAGNRRSTRGYNWYFRPTEVAPRNQRSKVVQMQPHEQAAPEGVVVEQVVVEQHAPAVPAKPEHSTLLDGMVEAI